MPLRYVIDRSHSGTPLPDDIVEDRPGHLARLSDAAGKPIIVNLWATWCGPCVEELPTLDRMAAAQTGRVRVIALSQDLASAGTDPAQFLAVHGWSHVEPWRDPDNAIGLIYGGGLPTTILFDASGQEVARVIGPIDWTGSGARALLAEAGIGE
ncbi:MAG: TlpA disulfide reductase family protein [Sphingopyxis sp.]